MSDTAHQRRTQRAARVMEDPYCAAVFSYLLEHGPARTSDLREALMSDRTRNQQRCGLARMLRAGLIRMSGQTHARTVSLPVHSIEVDTECLKNGHDV